jgi:hypothetical protein
MNNTLSPYIVVESQKGWNCSRGNCQARIGSPAAAKKQASEDAARSQNAIRTNLQMRQFNIEPFRIALATAPNKAHTTSSSLRRQNRHSGFRVKPAGGGSRPKGSRNREQEIICGFYGSESHAY